LGVCMLMLMVLQFGFQMNTYIGYILAVVAGAVATAFLSFKYTDAQRELKRVGAAINRLIQLQNKVKIRYVNNTNLLEYLYIKYDTDSANKLKKRWENYQQEKEERKQYAEAEAKTEYYQKQLVSQLVCSGSRIRRFSFTTLASFVERGHKRTSGISSSPAIQSVLLP